MPCQAQHVGALEEGDGMGDRWRRYVGSGEPVLETSQGEAQTTVPEPRTGGPFHLPSWFPSPFSLPSEGAGSRC